MAAESMNAPDPTRMFQAGINLPRGDESGGYGGRVEVASYEDTQDLDPDLRVTVYTGRGTAQLAQSLTPSELREFAGALERAADHADAVRAAARVAA